MERHIFNTIKKQLMNYKYSSMEYAEYEDISKYEVICINDKLILIYGYNVEAGMNEFHWSAMDVSSLLKEVNKFKDRALITFIPKEWMEEFNNNKFDTYAIWNDYFNNDIFKSVDGDETIEFLKEDNCKEASEVTLSCRGQSRGFSGQTEEWMKKWVNGVEANLLMAGGKDSAVLTHSEKDNIVGIVCVAIYGNGSDKGPTLWVREIAVTPKYQQKGIAKKLLNQALLYGKYHGTKRAFLLADECNEHAIRLYEKAGFIGNKNEAENDMIRRIKV